MPSGCEARSGVVASSDMGIALAGMARPVAAEWRLSFGIMPGPSIHLFPRDMFDV